jgi:hypothetical protein
MNQDVPGSEVEEEKENTYADKVCPDSQNPGILSAFPKEEEVKAEAQDQGKDRPELVNSPRDPVSLEEQKDTRDNAEDG